MRKSENAIELERLEKWCNSVLDYLLKHEPNSTSSRYLKELLPQLIEEGDLRELRSVFADLREFVGLLPPENHVELDEYLRTKTGRGLFDDIRENNKRIALVLRRGKIMDEDEYRVLMDRLNDTAKIGRRTEAISKIVHEYEQSILKAEN